MPRHPAVESDSVLTLPLRSIGVVGGGQLALMLAEAAADLDLELHLQTPNQADPAVRLASSVVLAPLADAQATRELAQRCGAISFENEWLPLDPLQPLAQDGVVFLPGLEALRPLVDKRSQRQLLADLHLPCPHWCPLADALAPPPRPLPDSDQEPAGTSGSPLLPQSPLPVTGEEKALRPRLPEGFHFPVMAKASHGGYDGRGTCLIADLEALGQLLSSVDPQAWILEEKVPFERELAITACRDREGNLACFPLVETHQHQHVCDWVLFPAAVDHSVRVFARNVVASLLTSLDYVGVLTVEFFWGPRGLQVNELAPRTHNSGHLTIEAFRHSQFEQQLRAVAGLPLGLIQPRLAGALMVNLLGLRAGDDEHEQELQALRRLEGAHLHWYGKRGGGSGRKLGHLTLPLMAATVGEREAEAQARLAEVRAIWPLPESEETSSGR